MRRFAMFVGVFLGCGAPVGTSSRGITGGSEAQSDAEVFMVSFRVFGVPNMCSATLIGERTLLTAAHCVDASLYPLSPTLRFEASNLTVARRASPTDLIEVIEVRMHPGWGLGHLENDLALMLLATAPEGVAPKPVNTEDLAPLTGQPLRALGYGYADPDEYDSWGTKRVTELRLERVEPGFLFGGDGVTSGICNGDSGGPSFMTFSDGTERLVGVHSTAETCYETKDVRVDAQLELIRDWFEDHETPRAVDAGAAWDGGPADGSAPDGPPEVASSDGGVTATADGGLAEQSPCAECVSSSDCSIDRVCVLSPQGPSCCVLGSRKSPPPLSADPESTAEEPLKTLRDVDSCAAVGAPGLGFWLSFVSIAGWRLRSGARSKNHSARLPHRNLPPRRC